MLDLGTGGGLPGIPLKIIYGNLNLKLLDSVAKKTAALSDIVGQLQLKNVKILTGRAEELSKSPELKGKFDYVISRAAGKLDEVTKWSRGFLKSFELLANGMISGGTLIVLKGGMIDSELRSARNLKFVESIEVDDIAFIGMEDPVSTQDFASQREKKIILVKYSAVEKKN